MAVIIKLIGVRAIKEFPFITIPIIPTLWNKIRMDNPIHGFDFIVSNSVLLSKSTANAFFRRFFVAG